MPHFAPDIYTTPQVGKLLADEARVLAPLLSRCTGDHGLHLTTSAPAEPPAIPLLGHWATVRVAGKALGGDVIASGLEPLPFVDEAFGVVLLRHALETTSRQDNLLDEAIRVLAPGGMLAITGIHPVGLWSPWVARQSRGPRPRLTWPWWWSQRLVRDEFDLSVPRRVGSAWPRTGGTATGESLVGGGYLLVARKKRPAAVPLRPRAAVVPSPIPGTLASGARRNARETL
ncbi:methyltransferase domain-containing protein [Luteibacter flocculans]|uniref:Methyltransferase domain-containing protein n=1 Tax=Luteibacter flocculans TaxID=2780091 RepID=A0ABY4SZL2_9GAMM|nr:methyltransferase domain-containing protein [Luteibacter flocculans]URL57252.1 methyltransferase domain-containing protein [Luteibacter flocculans]